MRPGVLWIVRPASPPVVSNEVENVDDLDKEGFGVGGELADAMFLRLLLAVVEALLRKEEEMEEVGTGAG